MRQLRLPHTIAVATIALAFALAAVGGPSPFPAPATAAAASCPGADSTPRQISKQKAGKLVVCLVNHQRAKHGLKKVKQRHQLIGAARGHSTRMQKTNCFDHVCPGEASLTGRFARADYLPCNCSWGAGENIAWGPREKGSPRAIVDAWMNSAPHRANILDRSYRDVGVGIVWGSPVKRKDRAGTYTLDFGYKR